MDAKQEHSEIYEHDIKTEPVFIYGQADENSIFIKPEKFKSDDEDELGDSIFESQVTEQLISVDKFKQDIDYEVPKTEELSEYPAKIDHDLVTEHVNIFPIITVKQEIEDTIKFEVIDIGDSDIKQDVCEYVHFKNESELLTSHCDLPTLKSEDENNDNPDYLTQPCSSSSTADDSKNCSKEHPCIDCQKNYPSSQSGFNQFGGSHFKNRLCVKQLSDPSQLCHVTINSKERQFKCDMCFKEFERKINFQQHLQIHANEKPFECDFCSKEILGKCNLHRHILDHYDEKPFKCDICSKEFYRKYHLKRHLLLHLDGKLFKCDICSNEFTQKSQLQQHLRTHTTTFKCDICSKEFNRKWHLKEHVLIHTTEKAFKCDICSKKFNQKSQLRKHLMYYSKRKGGH